MIVSLSLEDLLYSVGGHIKRSIFVPVILFFGFTTALSIAPAEVQAQQGSDRETEAYEDCGGWGTRLSAGVPVWMFDKEDTDLGGGIYLDTYSCCHPINLRVGAEVGHIDLSQGSALANAEFPGKEVNATFVRIPFAAEYVHSLGDSTQLFVGGGPDIINTANDVSDTNVGLHLSARLHHQISNHFGVALEGGYMWGEVDGEGGDIELDGAFVVPTVVYSF